MISTWHISHKMTARLKSMDAQVSFDVDVVAQILDMIHFLASFKQNQQKLELFSSRLSVQIFSAKPVPNLIHQTK